MTHLDKDSRKEVVAVIIVSLALACLILCKITIPWLSWTLALLVIWFAVFVTYFFRVPKRNPVGSDKIVSSVADGEIVIIGKVFEPEYLKRECIQISVYMNFFDMHANFWPVSGEVTYYKYHPGKHLLAFKPKASEDNEHTCTAIRTEDGQEVYFKQLAGFFARRIVNYANVGDKVVAGDQCGIIKFGSRIDMFLPLDAQIEVKMKEVTSACETIMARLR